MVTHPEYPELSGNMHFYGRDGGECSFKNYISGVMKEEIVKELRKKFEVTIDIDKK